MTKARQRVSKRLRSAKEKKELIPKRPNLQAKAELPKPIEISAAKGRPMLVWVGKRPLRQVIAFPAQHIESFNAQSSISAKGGCASGADNRQSSIWSDWPRSYPHSGLLFHGDNKEVLAHLLANGFRGKVKLIYIDPPFDSGADYVRRVQLRGVKGTARFQGEGYTLGEQIQYTDIWANDQYLQFMYERLILLKELLALDGSFFIHLDSRRGHYVKLLLDEVFSEANFRNELIIKRRITKNLQQQFSEIKQYPQAHDNLLWYTMDPGSRFSPAETVQARREEGYWHHFWSGEDRPTMRYDILGVVPASGQWKWSKEKAMIAVANYDRFLQEADGKNLVEYWEATGCELEFIRKNERTGKIENWFPPSDTRIANTLWIDIHAYENQKEYPTEKHEQLLNRIISFASNPGDLVLDCFIGSGTTAAVAQKLGRRWIGCDINKGAIQTTSKRLQAIIREQMEEMRKETQGELGLGGTGAEEKKVEPAQLSFAVYRVNDYDLQIQHNEAVNLACEHIGVTRTRGDVFFDGTLGKRLVKIIPFNHPLSPLDLEEVKKELSARPGEDRDVVVVCLGKELAADAWLEEWNRLRKKGDVPNKIGVIELRTDPKYGKFIKHEPARARVKVSRKNDKIHVVIEDFISPTILERLSQQTGVVKPHIDDWRAMVDCVMIDADYDGKLFNVCLSDVPEKKTDVVSGKYELPAPKAKTKVAVKIIDMLGEEVVEVREG
jgi:DNA modification methylase